MQANTANTSSIRTNLRRSLTGAILGLALTASATTASAQAVEARVDLNGLLCLKTTAEPYSDEPFVIGTSNFIGSNATTKAFQPPPKKVYPYWWNPSYYFMSYPTFGNIDGYEIVFSNNRPMWQGWIQNGQTVAIPLAFWEADSNYSMHDYCEDMAREVLANASSWLFGGGFSNKSILKMIVFSAKFFFGAGSDDPLGNLAVTLTNQGGVLYKEITAGEYSYIGGVTSYDFKTVFYWEVNQYKSLGYTLIGSTGGSMYLMSKPVYYGATSKSGKTVRVVLDGAGGEKYQASVQVRQGPFTSSKPNGACKTWTVQSSFRAY